MPCGKGSSSASAAGVAAGQRRGEGPSCPRLLHPHSPAEGPRPRSLLPPEGTGGGRCSAPACKKGAALSERPRSRKGLPGELPRPLALRERWGRPSWHPEPCDPRDPHLCLALDQPLQAAGVQRRGLGKGKREQKVRSSHAPDAGLEQPRGWAERRQEGHSRHCGRSAPAAGA